MREKSIPACKNEFTTALSDLGFSRVSYLVLHETGIYYEASESKIPTRWWKQKPGRFPDFQISAKAIQNIADIFNGRTDKPRTDKDTIRHSPPNETDLHKDEQLFAIGSRSLPSARLPGRIPVELWGKIQNSGLLHLAAFIGESQKPVYSVHNEHFSVLWAGCHGLFTEIVRESDE